MASGYSACNALLIFLLFGMVQEGNGQAPVTKICHLEGYDVNNLRRPTYIRFDLSNPNICPGEKHKESCAVYLSVCQHLPNNTSPEGSCNYYNDENDDVAVCMVVANFTKDSFGLGDYNTTIDPFQELPVKDGVTSFEATFYHGSIVEVGCPTTITMVIFVCDPSANWERYYRKDQNDDIYAVESPYLESAIFEGCRFILTVRYDGACKPGGPFSGDFGLPIDIGWILIIVAILLVVVYLVVGSIINLIRGGRTFSTIFPNYHLWLKFLSLVLEGFKMTFDYITCQPCRKAKGDYEKM